MENSELIIKYNIKGDFIEDEIYEILIESEKCTQIISMDSNGWKYQNNQDWLKSMNGKKIPVIYKGKSGVDNINIFLISPLQINRQLKLDQLL